MQVLLKEAMLNEIGFVSEKNAICFEFCNGLTENDVSKVVCENVLKVDINTTFLRNKVKFPCSVLEVVYGKLDNHEIANYFNKLHYGFRNNGKVVIPQSDFYWYFEIKGKAIEIHVLSSKLEKTTISKDF